jgi:hypothetical protein
LIFGFGDWYNALGISFLKNICNMDTLFYIYAVDISFIKKYAVCLLKICNMGAYIVLSINFFILHAILCIYYDTHKKKVLTDSPSTSDEV